MVTERHDDVIEVNSQEQLQDVARQVDECAEVATEPSDVVMALTRPGDVTSETLLVAIMERAFAHDLVRNPNRLGDVELGTRFSSPKGDWPPAFDAVEEREKTTWAEVAKLVCEPLAKAHLHDVLLTAGIVSSRQQAIDVCDHYLAVAELEHVSGRYRVLCLARVSSLARRYSLDVELVARRRMFRLCQVAVPEGNLGVVVDCLTSLCVAPRVGQFITPSRADLAQIAGGLAAKINNEWLADELLQVRLELAVSERERNEARRDYIGVFLHLAEAVQGLVRQSWLNRAAAEAKRLGQKDLEDQAVAAMQAMSADDLGLESVWLGGDLPRKAIEGRIMQYRKARSALHALDLWLTTPAPTGSYRANMRQAGAASHGILSLVTRVTLDAYGMPERTSAGTEEAKERALDEIEETRSSFGGIVLAGELHAIRVEFKLPSAGEIGERLAAQHHCDFELATAFGEALQSFWAERYGDAARAAYPLIEAGARGLLLALGEPLYRIQAGESGGRFPSLETYAQRLEALGFDEDWIRTLRNPVARLRNALAHGHLRNPSEGQAALLLRMAGLLLVLAPDNSAESDRAAIEERLRNPVGYAASEAGLRKRWKVCREWVRQPKRVR